MSNAWIGAGGAIVTALLAFALGRINLKHSNDVERQEALRAERLNAYAGFCAAAVEYRRAQLHRWFVGQDLAQSGHDETPQARIARVEHQRPEVAEDVRTARAGAWGCYYRVLMIGTDDDVAAQARHTLERTKQLKNAVDADEAEGLSNDVHDQVDQFARRAGTTVLATQNGPLV